MQKENESCQRTAGQLGQAHAVLMRKQARNGRLKYASSSVARICSQDRVRLTQSPRRASRSWELAHHFELHPMQRVLEL